MHWTAPDDVQRPWHSIAANQPQNLDVSPDEDKDKKIKFALVLLLYFVDIWNDWENTEKEEFLRLRKRNFKWEIVIDINNRYHGL